MEGDHNDLRFSRLFAELRAADLEDAPPFGALLSPARQASKPHARGRVWAVRWAVTASLLAATGLFVMKLAVTELPEPASETGTHTSDWWSSPTDCLLGGTDSFGSLETWQSPTDSLFDFAPTNENT